MRLEMKGGVLECFSGDNPNSIYGEAFDRVFVDEATRMSSGVFPAVLSTITATKGKARFAFNLDQGRRHWAVTGFLNAKANLDPEHGYVFLTTAQSPYVEPKTIEVMRRSLPDRVFRALYLGEIQEDGAGVFRDVESLHAGTLGVPEPSHDYIIGVDLARKADHSVAIVMDLKTRYVVGFERGYGEPWTVQADRLANMSRRWNNALIVPDATGVGDVVIAALAERNVPMTPVLITSGSNITKVGVPKGTLIQNLVVQCERKTFRYPAELETLTEELKAFEYDTAERSGMVTYSVAEGMHDDCVIALALTIWGARNSYVAPTEFIRYRNARRGGF
jgi:hypothetical protein